MYTVHYSKQAIRALRKLPSKLSARICKKIDELAESPYTKQQAKTMKGVDACRLRVGDWRVIYTVNDDQLEIWIVKVGPRGEIYKS